VLLPDTIVPDSENPIVESTAIDDEPTETVSIDCVIGVITKLP